MHACTCTMVSLAWHAGVASVVQSLLLLFVELFPKRIAMPHSVVSSMILLPAAIWLLASVDAIHPKSDDRIWGVHPPCFNGTTELPEYAFKNCRKIHMTTRDTDTMQRLDLSLRQTGDAARRHANDANVRDRPVQVPTRPAQ